MVSELIDNEFLSKHYKDTSIVIDGSLLHRFDIELRDSIYSDRRLELMKLEDGYRVWFYCSIMHQKEKTYFSAPIKDIKTIFELYQITSTFCE